MSETVLLLLHTDAAGNLPKAALEAVSAVQNSALAFSVGIVGANADGAANTLAPSGAQRYFVVTGTAFEQARYATDIAAAEAIARAAAANIVVAPGTSRFMRALPGLAVRLDGRVDTHIVALNAGSGPLAVCRWFYRQRMEGALTRSARPWILLLDSGIAQPYAAGPGTVTAETVHVDAPASRTNVVGVEALASDQQTIRPDSPLLFVAGAGWTKKQKDGQTHTADAARLILGFVQSSRASLGSSKSLVDMSGEGQSVLPFLSHMHQVGQTGATPRHPKGLATCCHGEEPHVVGWRFIGERRAVNLDPNCGWARGKADVLYVADAFEVMTRVNALIDEKGRQGRILTSVHISQFQ